MRGQITTSITHASECYKNHVAMTCGLEEGNHLFCYSRCTSCHRFDAINGLLVPGGSGNLTKGHPFYDNTEYLLKLAIEANDNGDYFPVGPLA